MKRTTQMRMAVLAGLIAGATPLTAEAFCGFYVGGDDTALYNNATMVVMMRDGTRTVLSMQNNYQGPPADFAMVVPVPVILQKENVKTLPHDVFDAVDRLAAPRLVEYWEQDPCALPPPMDEAEDDASMPMPTSAPRGGSTRRDLGVTVEAKFSVGEYEIVILSAKYSDGLDIWLREQRYNIPKGAEPLLRPYVTSGMKFFVAKVNADKVTFQGGQAILSPLRFHYDSKQFNLPIRLGLMNSSGTQDLLVHILSPRQRYEVANYNNVTIPTNLEVGDNTRKDFGAFYASLFDATMAKYPRSVITEYAWQATSCDPCPPGSPLNPTQITTLGADVMPSGVGQNYVLTRLHARYQKDALGEDLVFRAAEPIVGGREHVVAEGKIERGAQKSSINNFQARYIIRHEWTGPIACENPRRGIWGGPPQGPAVAVEPAEDIAFATRSDDVALASFLRQDVEEIDFKASEADSSSGFQTSGIQTQPASGCAGCTTDARGGLSALFLVLFAVLAIRRRSRVESV